MASQRKVIVGQLHQGTEDRHHYVESLQAMAVDSVPRQQAPGLAKFENLKGHDSQVQFHCSSSWQSVPLSVV